MPLEERAAIANSNQGDIFVSIHTNSAPRLSARGVESYYLNMTADPAGHGSGRTRKTP